MSKKFSLALVLASVLGFLPFSISPAGCQQLPLSPERQQALSSGEQAQKLLDAGKYGEALPLAQQSLALWEKTAGSSSLEVATALRLVGLLHYQQGRYAEAEPFLQRALTIRTALLGPEDPAVGQMYNNLGNLYMEAGQYAQAETFHRRAIAIRTKAFGPEHLDVARSYNNLANTYSSAGQYAQAEAAYLRALAIRQKVLGPDNPEIAQTLDNLGLLYKEQGRYTEAEALCRQGLALREAALGSDHPDVANSLNNLAGVYYLEGNYPQAEALFERALVIWQQAIGPESGLVARVLNNLALLYEDQGDYSRAEPLYRRSLAIKEKALGAEHPVVASSLFNLASLTEKEGNSAEAERLYRRAMAISEKAVGPQSPDVARSLDNLADLYRDRGEYARSERLYRRALSIREATLGAFHPELSNTLTGMAILAARKGDPAQSRQLLARSLDIQEHNLALTLASGSEAQKRAYLATFAESLDVALSLHLQNAPKDSRWARLALTTLLRRKGRVLEATSGNMVVLRRHLNPPEQSLLDELNDTRSQLATLTFAGFGGSNPPAQYKAQLASLQARTEELEATLSRRSALFESESVPATTEAVQGQIPAGTLLVELARYRPLNLRATRLSERFAPPRYAAYLLDRRGRLRWADLGDAASIEAAIAAFRDAVRDRTLAVERLKPAAARLARLLVQPLERELRAVQQVLIAPDSQLNLVPFAALVDGENHFLVERYSFDYLGSGRDLLRLAHLSHSQQPPLIVANPDFEQDSQSTTQPASATNLRSIDLAKLHFVALPASREEAAAIAAQLPAAQLLSGPAATESAIKQVHGPRILHIATHGFFLGASRRVENPLLRSGLALAGFNTRKSGSDDGVLTALEVSGLDLQGTQLVVLSACDTGLGEVADGEGVYGLKRALTLAGAESQLLSLWKVADEPTKALMVDYYRQLSLQAGRAAALRTAQLRMLGSREYAHPFYWAAFIPSGDWRPVGDL
ncbi:tetratricopeptide repeat protein [Gloeobacter kilaueensis]|uniref:Cellulose synthase subunit BcsC n=1 Tax=Gloeobacter kilaueensis (strain ATCC BAA-2537 / CCAP 1431/1 / ULC 316 / JS1) TaxID=1183438 RepID=U5QGJ7_GLOK1|nr:tetratricopeptide repeat protein [Gloeobacter kilaueensis]AGY56754.1 cellulose synthase subunit BcsC [Gloeobacter kilaueensis JS1]